MQPLVLGPLLALLLSLGQNELLDAISVRDYWQNQKVEVNAANMLAVLTPPASQPDALVDELVAKLGSRAYAERVAAADRLRAIRGVDARLRQSLQKTDDAETRAQIEALLTDHKSGQRADAVRRLMAIRALGELKAREAMPTLQQLGKSEAPFEAEYAARAIAEIEGRPTAHAAIDPAAVEKDLWLLPKNCGVVGQIAPGRALVAGKMLDIEQLVSVVPAEQRAAAHGELVGKAIELAHMIGNVRVASVTFGLADDVGDKSGYAVAVVGCKYDRPAMQTALAGVDGMKAEKIDGIDCVSLHESLVVMLLDEHVVLLAGPDREHLPTGQMVRAFKAGKGQLAENEAMAALIKQVDRGGAAWAVMNVSPAYAQAPPLAAFKTVTARLAMTDNRTELVVKARGEDAEQVAETVAMVKKGIEDAQRQLGEVANMMPAMKPLADLLAEVKVTADKTEATLTAGVDGHPAQKLMGIFAMYMTARSAHVEVQGPVELPDELDD